MNWTAILIAVIAMLTVLGVASIIVEKWHVIRKMQNEAFVQVNRDAHAAQRGVIRDMTKVRDDQ